MDADSSQIVEITAEGITYIDKEGQRRFIDFADCFNTYLKWQPERMIERERSSEIKQVGEVNYYGQDEDSRPYVGFFDSQMTGIHFSGPDECEAFCEKLLDMGWFLFDLSD